MSSRENEVKVKTSTKIKNYFRGVKAELKKVSWPTKKELLNYTVVVIITCAIMTLIVWGLDVLFQQLINLIVQY